MLYTICLTTAFFACVVGKICGMGGGVLIKPVLDAIGVLDVAAINALSGCTVAGMTCWSVGKAALRRESKLDLAVATPLALGAAVGGLAGKQLFALAASGFADADTAGGVQAALLFVATLATLLYTGNRARVRPRRVTSRPACVGIGVALGALGTFLGIGGGPFNMAVLYFFFSMPTKAAAHNSLYIILISQAAGLAATAVRGFPPMPPTLLAGMVLCGVLGGEMGEQINRRLSERGAARLFQWAMAGILAICWYNIAACF